MNIAPSDALTRPLRGKQGLNDPPGPSKVLVHVHPERSYGESILKFHNRVLGDGWHVEQLASFVPLGTADRPGHRGNPVDLPKDRPACAGR